MDNVFSALMRLEQKGDAHFIGPVGPDKGAALFGGQFVAQCLMAAQATVADGRTAHSLHAYFLHPGDVDASVEIDIEQVRDGRSFSSRQARAWQHGKECFRMQLSFQCPAESPVYVGASMPQVPPPEEVGCTYDGFVRAQTGASAWHGEERPMDIRYANPPPAREAPVTDPQLMWMRIRGALPPSPTLHQAGIAYLSDSTVVDQVMLPHGLRWHDAGFIGTSLDHAIWFHRPARADEWLLFEQSALVTGSGRGLAQGRFFDQSGVLVATCVQEGLMRWAS